VEKSDAVRRCGGEIFQKNSRACGNFRAVDRSAGGAYIADS